MHGNSRLSALFFWLVAGAPGARNFANLTAEIGRRLRGAGLPVDQFGIYNQMMHPEQPGRLDYWTEAAGPRISTLTPEQLTKGTRWVGTPAQVCAATRRMLIYSIGKEPRFDERPDMQVLMNRGYRQCVCLPLHSQYTPGLNIASFMTKRQNGFLEEQIEAFRELQAPIARAAESFVLHESTIGVLSTYVGRDAGARVLTGNILRGHTENIPSVVLFVDIKDFSVLSNAMPPAETVDLLNRFFSVLDAAVRKNGGEILKFIGDGALAIFPTPDDRAAQMAAVDGALAALEETQQQLSDTAAGHTRLLFRAALNLGDVHYGNIGSSNRMDFTVVGPTVNLAARLLRVAAILEKRTVCSDKVAHLLDVAKEDLGEHRVKGFHDPVRVFAID